jgi:predicted metalloprotease with PDZ domain
MRALAVALLLSVPLSAGDKSSLEEAVELFKSPDRRVRRSILSLVPGEVEKDGRDVQPQTPTHAALLALLQQRGPQRQAFKAPQLQAFAQRFKALQQHEATAARKLLLEAELTKKANRLLAAFGIHGARNRIKLQRGRSYVTGFGVLIVQKDSPAARLGLRKGDLILHLNGQAVARVRDFPTALGDKRGWSRVTASVWRDGQLVRLPKK